MNDAYKAVDLGLAIRLLRSRCQRARPHALGPFEPEYAPTIKLKLSTSGAPSRD